MSALARPFRRLRVRTEPDTGRVAASAPARPTDDRRLLATLAAQAAPAIRDAQLVREQAAEAAERERYEQELKVAQLIQQQFLPRELPKLPEWQVAAYYGPARVVGGDFYDFMELDDGRIGIAVGDVTDKGVPAAIPMRPSSSSMKS